MQFDTDSNGTIEFPEFCSMMSGRMLAGHDLDTVRMTFRALDISGSGRISCKQFKYLITNIGIYFIHENGKQEQISLQGTS